MPNGLIPLGCCGLGASASSAGHTVDRFRAGGKSHESGLEQQSCRQHRQTAAQNRRGPSPQTPFFRRNQAPCRGGRGNRHRQHDPARTAQKQYRQNQSRYRQRPARSFFSAQEKEAADPPDKKGRCIHIVIAAQRKTKQVFQRGAAPAKITEKGGQDNRQRGQSGSRKDCVKGSLPLAGQKHCTHQRQQQDGHTVFFPKHSEFLRAEKACNIQNQVKQKREQPVPHFPQTGGPASEISQG